MKPITEIAIVRGLEVEHHYVPGNGCLLIVGSRVFDIGTWWRRIDRRGISQAVAAILVPAALWLLLALSLTGCAATPPPAPAPVKDTIPELAPAIEQSAAKSADAASKIKVEAAQGTKAAHALPQAAPVIPFFSRIDLLADVVKAEADRIAGPVKVQLAQVQAERAALDRELAEAREGLAAKDKEIERVKGEARQRITALCEWASFVAFALAIASLIGGYFIKNFIAGITGFVALTIAGGLFALYAVEFDWIIYGSGGLVLAVVVGAAVWAWRTGKFSNPHLVNPTEQWAEAAERWSKGKAAEAIAILRTTAAGEAIYQNTIRPAMEAAKGGA